MDQLSLPLGNQAWAWAPRGAPLRPCRRPSPLWGHRGPSPGSPSPGGGRAGPLAAHSGVAVPEVGGTLLRLRRAEGLRGAPGGTQRDFPPGPGP